MSINGSDVITLTAHCLCKANIFTTQISKSSLPLTAFVCHCDSCRHVTGALYSVDVRWPTPRAEVDISKLKTFHHFPSIDLLFCPTCSSPMFFADRNNKERKLGVFTGVLTNENVDLIRWKNHIFVEETLDGGATVWMQKNLGGEEIMRFKLDDERNEPEELESDWPPADQLTGYQSRKEDCLPIQCKCKGVDLILHRGDYSNVLDEDLPPNIDPKTHKLLASMCPCDSCRLQAGVEIINWTFTDMKNISFASSRSAFPGSAAELRRLVDNNDPAIGTLSYYASSLGVERYFCSKCSACIFYANDTRPQIIDVAIGVLHASDGARAEGFLAWPYGSRPEFINDGDGGWRENFYAQAVKEAEEYRISRNYPNLALNEGSLTLLGT